MTDETNPPRDSRMEPTPMESSEKQLGVGPLDVPMRLHATHIDFHLLTGWPTPKNQTHISRVGANPG